VRLAGVGCFGVGVGVGAGAGASAGADPPSSELFGNLHIDCVHDSGFGIVIPDWDLHSQGGPFIPLFDTSGHAHVQGTIRFTPVGERMTEAGNRSTSAFSCTKFSTSKHSNPGGRMRKTTIVIGALFGSSLVACTVEDTPTESESTAAVAASPSRVWIQYTPNGKGRVIHALGAANATLHYEFDDIERVVATVPAAALQGLEQNPDVVEIEADVPRYPMSAAPGESPPYGVGMVGALAMQAAGFTGAGVNVCIIDSGLRVQGGSPTTNPVTYISGNLPPNQDGFGHGTHVAGTIAGQPYTIGVAPGAHLIIVRVFGDDGAWAYSSTLADAASKCGQAGARVISMSLGGGLKSRSEDTMFSNLYNQGVLSIAAAGNGGNTQTSYPAGYASVVSVAAIDSAKAHATFSQTNKDVELSAPGVHVWSSLPYLDIAEVTANAATYTGSPIEFAALGTVSGTLVDGGLCDSVGSWSGKVVLCQRGTISFYDKVHNAQLGGATGAVIYNNVSGGFLGTLGSGNSSTIPAIGISMEDGQTLVASALGASASERNTHDTTQNGFDAWDGTSMATPHVSGVAALVMSACPGATAAQVRSALQSGAEDLGAAGRDTTFGYGLVRACQSANALCGNPASCP
jgi:serine protease